MILSNKEVLHDKFKITTDPVVWKIKLPHRVEDDHVSPSMGPRLMRRRMAGALGNTSPPQSLDYSKYHEMYSHRR